MGGEDSGTALARARALYKHALRTYKVIIGYKGPEQAPKYPSAERPS